MTSNELFRFRSATMEEAALRSERVRIIGMLALLAIVLVIGLVRVVRPIAGAEGLGWMVTGLAVVYLAYEGVMLVVVSRRIERRHDLPRIVWRLNVMAESLLPVIAMAGTALATSIDPYVALLGPSLAFMYVLIIISVLRIDPVLSALGGAVCTLGYVALVIIVFARFPYAEFDGGVHHWSYYILMPLMLAIATVVAGFVAHQVRQHVGAALEEAEIRRQKERMERDLEVARTIQRSLLPEGVPEVPGYDLAASSVSADQTGGDYYDWQPTGDGRVVISLGDVTGHGVGPALVTAACRAYVRALVDEEAATPADVLDRVNRLLHQDIPDGRFVTFALLELDPARHRGVFLSAGHGPSFYVVGGDGDITSIDSQGLPLAVLEEQELDGAITFEFQPGDLVVLFSDGFFEWANAEGEQYGLERLREVVRSNRHEPAATVIQAMDEAVRGFVGPLPQADDMTVVVIKREES